MKTMTLDEYISNQPDQPTPVAITGVRPCFSMFEGGLKRTRPAPTLLARNGALEDVARVIDLCSQGGGACHAAAATPDEIVHATGLLPAEVGLILSFLLFISAVTRDAGDLYRANCPCVEGEALSRFQAL